MGETKETSMSERGDYTASPSGRSQWVQARPDQRGVVLVDGVPCVLQLEWVSGRGRREWRDVEVSSLPSPAT